MNSSSLPRSTRAERFVANSLRAAIPLASLGVLGFLILRSPHSGSSAIAVLLLFAVGFLLTTALRFTWKSMGLSRMVLADVIGSLKLALALTATMTVILRSLPQGMVYGSLLLILFMLSFALESHADRREARATQGSTQFSPTVASKAEPPAIAVDPELKARLEGVLYLLKRNS